MPTYGIEEEVFITESERPSFQSLYYLSKLLWRNPFFYYTHSASNFARGSDAKQGIMSGVEVATGLNNNVDDAINDLNERRKDLISVSEGLIVPLGHLINFDAPTNTCAFQIHIGEVDNDSTYKKLVYFLPLLTLLAANSPFVNGSYFGQSYRMSTSYAIGHLRPDPLYRFQDIIITRRLGTIEIRIFDPIWDLNRIKILLKIIDSIVVSGSIFKYDVDRYNCLRDKVVKYGYVSELDSILDDLNKVCDAPKELFVRTPSDEVKDFYQVNGLLKTYSALDNGYRNGEFKEREIPEFKYNFLKTIGGFGGYYIPKLPYITWKYWREWF